MISEHYDLWEIWENTLQPRLDQIAEPLLKMETSVSVIVRLAKGKP